MGVDVGRSTPGKIPTNGINNSQCTANVKPVTFKELWDEYPSAPPFKVNGSVPKGFENQCAIRMSATFHAVGYRMESFSQNNKQLKVQGGRTVLGRIVLKGKATATRADELAQWLELRPICGIGQVRNITGKDWQNKVKGKTGIIFFGGYWTQDGDSSGQTTGGHIDLWNGSRMTSSNIGGAITNYMRFTLGIDAFDIFLYSYSDLGKADKILFFDVK